MRRRTRILLAVTLSLLVLTAGCSASSDSGGSADHGDGAEATAAAGASSGGSGDSSGSGASGGSGADAAKTGQTATASTSQVAAQQSLIKTGEVHLRVDDYESARANLTAAVEAQGGYVSDSEQNVLGEENRTWTRGSIVFRVPKDNYDAFLQRVRAEGSVEYENTETVDVTDQVVDLQARLDNLRSERDRLRELYQRANETDDVLAVQERLAETQGEIERLEAQLRSLQNRVAYSTLTVNLTEPQPQHERIQRASWYDTPVTSAFVESIDGVGVVLRALAVGAAYVAPYALVFGLPLVALAVFVRRLR